MAVVRTGLRLERNDFCKNIFNQLKRTVVQRHPHEEITV